MRNPLLLPVVVLPLLACLAGLCEVPANGEPRTRKERGMRGPLRVHPANPRYFTDGSGKAVYLTGSHTWNVLQDSPGAPPFDYAAYLDLLEKHGHNLFRLWIR